jgi:release factor glutamine methyltransferase
MALVAGISGYEALFRIISEAHRHLNENGYIILEHGFDQATEIKRRLATSFYYDVTSYKDLNEIDRVTIAKRIQVNQHG